MKLLAEKGLKGKFYNSHIFFNVLIIFVLDLKLKSRSSSTSQVPVFTSM